MGLTKAQLEALNDSSFPNNNGGLITPQVLRDYNDATIVNTVNQDAYTADSASFNTRILAVTGSATSTGSLLLTASFDNGTRNLTFTKGDATTFNVNIPDVSGSAGDFVTTSSFNAYTQSNDQRVSSLETNSASVNISISNINQFTQSAQISINALNAATSSYATSAITASSLVTASFDNGTRNLTFTKGDSTTFAVNIPDVSGSAGDFVTTASFNAYTQSNDQRVTSLETNSGSVNTSITNINTFTQSANISINALNSATSSYATSAITASSLITASVNLNTITFTKGDASTFNITVDTGSGGSTISVQDEGSILGNASSFNFNGVGVTATLSAGTASITIPGGGGSIDTGSFATTGSNTFTGNQTISTAGNSQVVLIAQPGFQTNVEFQSENSNFQAYGDFRINNNGQFGGSGSIKFTTSNNLMELAADQGIKIGATNGGGNGIDAGAISMQVRSGSLSLAPAGFSNTTASLTHLSSSSNTNFVNLIFKNNNTTTDTIISGSNNLFVNPAVPAVGFKRYIGGSGNIILNASNVPQISGSMGFSPVMNNNYFGGPQTTFTMRGPVSSSTYTIVGNQIVGSVAIGSTATNNAERLVSGLSFQQNIVAGIFSVRANQSDIRTSAIISNNNVNGTVTLNLSSSAAAMNNNTINDNNFTINNQFSSGAIGFGQAALNFNTIGGNGTTFIITGSQSVASPFQAGMIQNLVLGSLNTAFVNSSESRVSGSNVYHNMIATALIGQRLIVTGSSNLNDTTSFGSAFVGRFNADDSIRNKTSDVVFAVGTGTSVSNRKTGFLIDSGSNTFVEGTLNVSGSTTMTGSITIQSGSGDLFVHGNKQFNGAQYSSLVTQSGSAAVSQSVTFDTTGPEFGVSLVDNTKLTVANSGTYNIQFSAQLLADTGADNVFIWFKKNGTNIAGSASELVIQNNDEALMTVNILDTAAASDFYELCWQSTNGDAVLLAAAASGNIPSIPSIIATITQVR